MSEAEHQDSTEIKNELSGLKATEAAQCIHDDIRLPISDVVNEYTQTDPEYDLLRAGFESVPDSHLNAHIPATESDDPYLTLSIYLADESVVVDQRNVSSTDTYCMYAGYCDEVLPALAEILEMDYIEVDWGGDAVEIMRDELNN